MARRVCCFLFCTMICFGGCLRIETSDSETAVVQDTVAMTDYVIEEYSATSLTGRKLFPPALSSRDKSKLESQLSAALEQYNSSQDELENIIWFGRRLAYLFLYKEAIKVFSDGLQKFPDAYELYRHRGHRFLTIRDFDGAISDLQNAAFYMRNKPLKMEETGVYGRRSIPRSSVQFNVWYHLGLSYYLKGNYDKAVSAYKQCLELSNNDDMLVAATKWLYMTYRRLGSTEAAQELLIPIKSRMNVIENKAYHNILLMYKEEKRPSDLYRLDDSKRMSADQVTYAYAVGNWHYFNGRTEIAFNIFNKIMESEYWPAYGYLAAEVELFNQKQLGS